ncbi:MAG: 3-methyl-2-oxobutanoate hydroxymethyltransferase [Rhizobiales bacterium]|nr:3-methyl-2-oxobutanoate hydroxymethyltransferase [Hyphomicrobiales bacterium]MBO6697213.1 3-methyl-2-oxobutanoate hydroxymethyltransferase [Hyphomicrobiales bacterium]MBO6736532.1 3-methyl-2-oxobutanoate hydroxymethyltransferase [Hyphomicrobiales bacterium]MBO6913002.1 3-methyl-2-oxobutanoate hydroxymethyltransferase [Hyphomicrobiales bacterium]MBO6956583.1 3-methyl-2-oxobutanoate hydroxymethyltransferase [Hyphomicrobiales bacterium]
MARQRPTVADLRAAKGKRQMAMLRYFSLDEAAAAEAAGIDIASVPPELVAHPRYRDVAPTVFSMTGKTHLEYGSTDDYLRFCGQMMETGADALYCSGAMQTVERLANEFIPIVGHVGIVPARATWTGGFRAVGRDADTAIRVYEECKAYQQAGAIAVEIEVVPDEVARAISERLDILLWSMGSGGGCDAQYLFAEDILGEGKTRVPRHAKIYRDFAAEYERLQNERVAAFKEFSADVESGAFPETKHLVSMKDGEYEKFLDGIGG